MLPRDVVYSFENTGQTNLVILRAGLVVERRPSLVMSEPGADLAAMRHVIDHFVADGTRFTRA